MWSRGIVFVVPIIALGCGNDTTPTVTVTVHDPDSAAGVRFFDADAAQDGTVFAVGLRSDESGAVLRHDQGGWTALDTPGFIRAFSVFAPAVDDVWVGGFATSDAQPALVHWDGVAWTGLDEDILGDGGRFTRVNAIWGTGTDDVWVIAAYGDLESPSESVFHFDGTAWADRRLTWSPESSEGRTLLRAGCSASPDEVSVFGLDRDFGDADTWMFDWDGSTWQERAIWPRRAVGSTFCRGDERWMSGHDGEGTLGIAAIVSVRGGQVDTLLETSPYSRSEEPGDCPLNVCSLGFGSMVAGEGAEIWVIGTEKRQDDFSPTTPEPDPLVLLWKITDGGIQRILPQPGSVTGQVRTGIRDASGRLWAFGDDGLIVEFPPDL